MTDSEMIVRRFFEALDSIIAQKAVKNVHRFALRYGINEGNLYKLRMDNSRRILDPEWLAFLVRDYQVNARWLLTGQGKMFRAKKNGSKQAIHDTTYMPVHHRQGSREAGRQAALPDKVES